MAHIAPIALRQAMPNTEPHPTAAYWRKCQVEELFNLPFVGFVLQAASLHRQNLDSQKKNMYTMF